MTVPTHPAARKPARGPLKAAMWAALSRAGRAPVAGAALAQAYRRYFNAANAGHVRLFRGMYPTFDAARRDIPRNRIESYDNEPSAGRMIGEWNNVDAADYPVLFWLARLLPGADRVFDWGGNVGLKYFAFERLLDYPAALAWLVNDVPAVVRLGREVAAAHAATALHFTTTLEDLPGSDILLASGALQFIEQPLERMRSAGLPPHLVLNKLPIYDAPSAVTLHNMGTALCPYHLFNREEFVRAIEGLDFELVDEWRTPGVGCEVPFHPDRSISAYTGFYFRRRGASGETPKRPAARSGPSDRVEPG